MVKAMPATYMAQVGQPDRPKGASVRRSPGTILPQVLTDAGQSGNPVPSGCRPVPRPASGRLCRPQYWAL